MFLKTFIKELQDLYDNYDPEAKKVLGEPIIYFESFEKCNINQAWFFKGLSHNVNYKKTEDGNFILEVR